MKHIFILFFISTFSISANSQQNKIYGFQKNDGYFSFVIGHKTTAGTFGMCGNYFLTKNFTGKLSIGHGASNYNGMMFSIGPEFYIPILPKFHLSFGSVYSFALGNADVIGDDESQDYFWYESKSMQYIRTFLGIDLFKEPHLKLEIGYSHPLKSSNFSISGPGTPTNKQLEKIENGLGSGLSIAILVGVPFNFKKK